MHNPVSDAETPDNQDTLVQARAVTDALRQAGHEARSLAFENAAHARDAIAQAAPDVVFNLVESQAGGDLLDALAAELFESAGVAFTGSGSRAIRDTCFKVPAKRAMLPDLPTPAWIERPAPAHGPDAGGHPRFPATYIIKSSVEHASRGIDDTSVVHAPSADWLRAELERRAPSLGGAAIAEAYIDGREFNLSLMGDAAPGRGARVLPPAEIVFDGYPSDKPHIVGYAAKWHEGSFEFSHTPRRFDFPASDAPLLAELRTLALACWEKFGLAGYARVDFRVDADGPWVLEVNTNPCVSPDAGFAAAVARAGMTYAQAMDLIVREAHARLHALSARRGASL